jgi:toxin ParE1/3/4
MKKHAWGFHPAADRELNAAASRYDEFRPGLGDAFLDAIEEKLAIAASIAAPGTRVPGIADEMVRRIFLAPRFPYQLVLVIDVDMVLAVAHLRRHPDYWRKRLPAARKTGAVKKSSGRRHTSKRRP